MTYIKENNKISLSEKKWLTTAEAADLFGISHVTLYKWFQEGNIKKYPLGKRSNRWNKADIDRHIKSLEIEVKNNF